jgi:hypothetical protein
MTQNSSSFKPGQSGNPKGRPKGVRTLSRLIDTLGDETYTGVEEDYRTTTIRRLWQAASSGTLNLGAESRELKTGEWVRLVQWLVTHMDKVAIKQWDWQGQMQIRNEGEWQLESAKEGEAEETFQVEETEMERAKRITASAHEKLNAAIMMFASHKDDLP